MKIISTRIPDLIVIQPNVWSDDRGYFFEAYNDAKMKEHGLDYDWIQDNEAQSTKGVIRGLHYQTGSSAQAKLVRVVQGEVLDVVVDLRESSPTYGECASVILSANNKKQLLVPRGFAHGYLVLSDAATFLYKVDNGYDRASEAGIHPGSEELDIEWILPRVSWIQSEKDQQLPTYGAHTPSGIKYSNP